MLKKISKFLLLLVPLLFLMVGINYKDSTYYFFSLISTVIIITVFFPSYMLNKKIKIFQNKEIKHDKKKELSKILRLSDFKKFYYVLPSIVLTITASVMFTFLNIYFLATSVSKGNFFTHYFSSYIEFIYQMRLFFGLFFIFLVAVSVFIKKKEIREKIDFLRVSLSVFLLGVVSIFLALNLAILLTFIVAVVHINLISLTIKINPAKAGIISGKEVILKKLKESNKSPTILIADKNFEQQIIPVLINHYLQNKSFYIQQFIKSIPQGLILNIDLPNSSLLLVKNSLIIKEVNKDDIQFISPTLGKLLIKGAVKPRYIKDEPIIEVMGRQEYIKFREDQINKEIEKMETLIADAQNTINLIYSDINKAKQGIESSQSAINQGTKDRDYYYDQCINAGYYGFYTNTFYHYYSKQYCDNKKSEWDSYINTLQENVKIYQSNLQYAQSSLSEYQGYKKTLEDYKTIIAAQKDVTPQELGLFEPKKSIKIALDYISSKSVIDYFATLIHEYLHYTSYVSEERILSQFFEEGLTEYYARKAMKDQTNIDTNLGYPLITKIIGEIVKKIPQAELESIYYSKDQKALISNLDYYYGKDFYKNSEYYFNIIPYLSGHDALKVANNIMFKIGGKELIEKDLYSTIEF